MYNIRYIKRICPYCGLQKDMVIGQLACDECEAESLQDKDFQEEFKDA